MRAITHTEAPRNEPSQERPHVLIVDDDSYVREVIAQSLELKGYQVEQAANGKQALAMASAHAPDVVVLDPMLTGLGGFEVATRLRSMSAAPILILASRFGAAEEVVRLGLGATDYITKPFRPRELVSRVRAMTRFDQ